MTLLTRDELDRERFVRVLDTALDLLEILLEQQRRLAEPEPLPVSHDPRKRAA